MASITLTPTNIYQYYEWNNSWAINEYRQYKTGYSLLQMPSLTSYGISASNISKITIVIGTPLMSAEEYYEVSSTIGIGFTTSVKFPTSYTYATVKHMTGGDDYPINMVFNVSPSVSVASTWYIGTEVKSGTTNYGVDGEDITVIIEYSTANTVKYYTGSAWVDCIVNYYNGSKWVECVPYYYNGSSWVEISTS